MALTVTPYNGGAPIMSFEGLDTTATTSVAIDVTSGNEVWLVWGMQREGGSTAPAPTWTNNGSLPTREDLLDGSNGATDYACRIFVQRYKIASSQTGRTFTWTDAAALANVYCYAYDVSGQDTTQSLGGKASGQSGVTNGALNPTLDAAPTANDLVLEFIMGTLNSGAGAIDPDNAAGFSTELFDTGRTDWNKREAASRTGSTSTTVGWSDVSNNASPVSYYKNPVYVAFTIKAAAGGGGGGATLTVDSGSLALEGQNVGLISTDALTLPVTAGQMALEGQEVPFILTTVGTEGQLALEGQQVALLAQSTMGVTEGQLALEGQNISLLTALTLVVDSGQLALGQGDVNLVASGISGTGARTKRLRRQPRYRYK